MAWRAELLGIGAWRTCGNAGGQRGGGTVERAKLFQLQVCVEAAGTGQITS